jgi:signal transduction histidine kinase
MPLLRIYRVGFNHFGTVLFHVVESALSLLYHRVKLEKIKVVKELAPDLPRVLSDKLKMEQVFINILLNAIQAMPNGGSLFVSSEFDPVFSEAKLTFKDTGIGMDEEEKQKVFDEFYRARNKQTAEIPGTGLGSASPSGWSSRAGM